MATLRKRGSKWHVQVRLSRHNQTRSFSHKADAETWARLVERNIDTGEINNGSARSSSTKPGDLLKRYSEEVYRIKKCKSRAVYYRPLPTTRSAILN